MYRSGNKNPPVPMVVPGGGDVKGKGNRSKKKGENPLTPPLRRATITSDNGRKAVKERVASVEHTEKGTIGGSPPWKAEGKTSPELRRPRGQPVPG